MYSQKVDDLRLKADWVPREPEVSNRIKTL